MNAAASRNPPAWLLAWLAAASIFTLLALSYAAIGLGPAILTGAWHSTIALAVWFIAGREAARNPWPHPNSLTFAARHVAIATAVTIAWALLEISTLVMLSDWLLEGPLERFPIIDAVEDLIDPFEAKYADDPIILVYRLLAGAAIYLGLVGLRYLLAAHDAAARSDLLALRAQLNPHFLFNTLHTIASMVRNDAAAAEVAIEQLGDLLRYVLRERTSEFVTVADEWAFAQQYLALQQRRYENVRVTVALDPSAEREFIPPMTLQPLIENCFSHGGLANKSDARISITACLDGSRLRIAVEDNGASTVAPAHAAGTGLANLRRRLQHLFGPTARLVAEAPADGGFRVLVEVPRTREEA